MSERVSQSSMQARWKMCEHMGILRSSSPTSYSHMQITHLSKGGSTPQCIKPLRKVGLMKTVGSGSNSLGSETQTDPFLNGYSNLES